MNKNNEAKLAYWKSIAHYYAGLHGLENPTIITGERGDDLVVFSDRAGATRWHTEFEPERDSRVFASLDSAEDALAESKRIYGDIDKEVVDIKIIELDGPEIDI